jgi:hypothetical protein
VKSPDPLTLSPQELLKINLSLIRELCFCPDGPPAHPMRPWQTIENERRFYGNMLMARMRNELPKFARGDCVKPIRLSFSDHSGETMKFNPSAVFTVLKIIYYSDIATRKCSWAILINVNNEKIRNLPFPEEWFEKA